MSDDINQSSNFTMKRVYNIHDKKGLLY
jgi:hypothetical protein